MALAALQRDRPRLWLLFGAVAALGLVMKVTMLFFGSALFLGLLLSATGRRHLRTRWPWLGALIALCGLVPYIAWNATHGWPTLAFYSHYRLQQAQGGPSPATFLEEQILLASVLSLPLWVARLVDYLGSPKGAAVRALGWVYVLLLVVFGAGHAKPYFLTPLYPVLFAGAVRLEAWAAAAGRRGWIRLAYPVAVVVGAAALAPIVMPVLPAAAASAYSAPLHVGEYTDQGNNPIIQPLPPPPLEGGTPVVPRPGRPDGPI